MMNVPESWNWRWAHNLHNKEMNPDVIVVVNGPTSVCIYKPNANGGRGHFANWSQKMFNKHWRVGERYTGPIQKTPDDGIFCTEEWLELSRSVNSEEPFGIAG